MGCDIHLFVEKKHKGKWVMSHEVRGHGRERDYRLFAAIAGVRGDGPKAKGLPIDISESTNYHADWWNGDAHNHSWMTLREAIPLWNAPRYPEDKGERHEWPAYHFFEIEAADDDELDDWRVVFWFDN